MITFLFKNIAPLSQMTKINGFSNSTLFISVMNRKLKKNKGTPHPIYYKTKKYIFFLVFWYRVWRKILALFSLAELVRVNIETKIFEKKKKWSKVNVPSKMRHGIRKAENTSSNHGSDIVESRIPPFGIPWRCDGKPILKLLFLFRLSIFRVCVGHFSSLIKRIIP